MKYKFFFLLFIFYFLVVSAHAQNNTIPYFKGAIKENRITSYRNIINNVINKNLSLPLADSTEENWQDAFWAMELLQYKSPWADNQAHYAFDSIENRSLDFQRALLELVYANYPEQFDKQATHLLGQTTNEKVFALCTEYLLQSDSSQSILNLVQQQPEWQSLYNSNDSKLADYCLFIISKEAPVAKKILPTLFAGNLLSHNVIVYSIQRKNRDYPGIVIVKDTLGNFVKNNDGSLFYVPQLARSISNLPFYLTNGNTPQGIFRMDGFGISKTEYIGPTENIQLTMPFETSIQHFLNDSTITDTVWSISLYKKLLPGNLKDYAPLYQTYYAGEAGRSEIIAHGTTVNPQYYSGKIYYPLTPTEGCLCTKEIWSGTDGKRAESDQQKLIDAVKKAGGAQGYYIVIEIDNQSKPVQLQEILPFIK